MSEISILQKYGLAQKGLVRPETGDEAKMLSLVGSDPQGGVAAILPQQVFINSFLKKQQVNWKKSYKYLILVTCIT